MVFPEINIHSDPFPFSLSSSAFELSAGVVVLIVSLAADALGLGSAIRSYTCVADMVEGIYLLMHSTLEGPANIGWPQYVSVDELVRTVADVVGKKIHIRHIEDPVGVQSRNFSNARIVTTGWQAKHFLKDGIALTYPWIESQVRKS